MSRHQNYEFNDAEWAIRTYIMQPVSDTVLSAADQEQIFQRFTDELLDDDSAALYRTALSNHETQLNEER